MSFLRIIERAGSAAFLAIVAFEASIRLHPFSMLGFDVLLDLVAGAIAVWTLASALHGGLCDDVRRVVWSFGLLALAVPAFLFGRFAGDPIAVAIYGPRVRAAMTTEGRTASGTYSLGGTSFASSAIVYDDVDSDDPAELARVGRIATGNSCDSNARRIGPHFYVAAEDCGR